MRLWAAVVACLAAWTAGAGSSYRLVEPVGFADRPDTFAPLSGGHVGGAVQATDAAGSVLASFPTAVCGMTVSETGERPVVGGCLAPPDDLDVDWAAFSQSLSAQAAVTDGYVFYVASATNVAERLVVARSGAFKIDWKLVGGGTETVAYESAAPAAVSAYRLFWTSAPFNGNAVTIPSNYGVELHGDGSLFYDAAHANANGAGRCDYGVDFNPTGNLIQAYATVEADGTVRGPKGLFVVAYYDSGRKNRYLGCTVVSVEEPAPVELHATVGAEVLPQNERYDPTSGVYSPEDASNDSAQSGIDPRAPYFWIQKRQAGQYHAKENRVYAIAPTVSGRAGAKRAMINWLVSDAFDVRWSLEQSYYHVTWPEVPTVVLARSGSAPGVTVPDAYALTLLDWQEPGGAARVESDALVISRPGRFTLKLTNLMQDDFWLVPLAAAYGDDETVFPCLTPVRVDVGREVRPVTPDGASEDLRALVASVDTNVAAFVCEAASPGRNWNPNLYHVSSMSNAADSFAALASSVWLVNVTDCAYDAEVWWFRKYLTGGMTDPLTFPVLPQRCKAAWPSAGDVAEIVFSSGRGSGAGGRAATGRALSLAEPSASGSVRFRSASEENGALTAAFAFHPAVGESRSAGEVLSLSVGEACLSFAVRTPQTDDAPAVCSLTLGSVALDVTCPADRWTRYVVVAATNGVSLYADERLAAHAADDLTGSLKSASATLHVGRFATAASACGVALDDISAWNVAHGADVIVASATNALATARERAVLDLSFDDAVCDEDGLLVSCDDVTLRSFAGTGFAVRDPGAPAWQDGWFAASDGVTPRAYVQNDPAKIGYKPNVEHALVLAENGGYGLYALRTDMNSAERPPVALVEYAENGRGAMRLYRVAMTNEWYAWPSNTCAVGEKIPIFHPFDAMPSGLSTASEYVPSSDEADGSVAYFDRAGDWWARRDGAFGQCMAYVAEPGFVAGAGDDGDLAGLSVPAANLDNCFGTGSADASKTPVDRRDAAWLLRQRATEIPIRASWPKDVPVMSVAQVLSKPESGLPDVYGMKSCAVAYPFYGYQPDGTPEKSEMTRGKLLKMYPTGSLSPNRVVKLLDPTCRKTVEIGVTSSFPDEYGFSLGASGNLSIRQGCYYFRDLPANVADRLFVDVSSAGVGKAHLCLVGDYVDNAAGAGYLRANSLTEAEKDGVRSVFAKVRETASDPSVRKNLDSLIAAVDSLYALGDVQPSRQTGLVLSSDGVPSVVTNEYRAADHYALVAETDVPAGGSYVVLVENDGPEAGPQPVSFHVLFVTNTLYCGRLVTVTDSSNALSEKANVVCTAPLGKAADQYRFEWQAVDAPADGHVPRVPSDASAGLASADPVWASSVLEFAGVGQTCVDAVADANTGKVTAKALANRYWTMHCRATNETCAVKGWSAWCQPTLVEGWVQRVLNAITPFSQRLSDLSANRAELGLTMLQQIGAPWEGDVALNDENLNNVGLVQLYQTVLNRAESMSIAQADSAATTPAVNKQLVECAARLADLYMTLGGEAYSDAMNPLVGSSDGTAFAGDVFCFANQVPTLLDEELALLRGRSASVAPALTESPFYNRLMWNFTKGVTQGEVAYVSNYNVKAVDGVLDAAAAAKMYPQGHGDAYGHYLSALKGYYRLLRNPHFSWGEPSMMEMLVAGHVVNMDYEEEDKFAECACNLAKIGDQVVKLTGLKQFRDNGTDVMSGYFDNPATRRTTSDSSVSLRQSFGYGEWGCRAGYGALCNWAVANALLPPDATNAVTYFKDQSVATVTRATSASLAPLGASVASVEHAVNTLDAGGNVIGLDVDDIPFRELSSAAQEGLEGGVGAVTPYEQMREIAGEALEKAEAAQAHANAYGSRLAAIEDEQQDLEASAAEQEASCERELVAIFGRPFADDIGPGKTYEQGYAGPDLYHYMYMNLKDYGLTNTPAFTCSINWLEIDNLPSATDISSASLATITTLPGLQYDVTADGLVAMPTNWSGMRAAEGKVQAANRNFLSATVSLKAAYDTYNAACGTYSWAQKKSESTISNSCQTTAGISANLDSQRDKQLSLLVGKGFSLTIDWIQSVILGSNEPEPSPTASGMKTSIYVFNSVADKDTYLASLEQNVVASATALLGTLGLGNEKTSLERAVGSLFSIIDAMRSDPSAELEKSLNIVKDRIQFVVNTVVAAPPGMDGQAVNLSLAAGKTVADVTKAEKALLQTVDDSAAAIKSIVNGNFAVIKDSKIKVRGQTFTIPHIKMTKVSLKGYTKGFALEDPLFGAAVSITLGSIVRTCLFGSTFAWYADGVTMQRVCDFSVAEYNYAQSIRTIEQSRLNLEYQNYTTPLAAYNAYRSAAEAQNKAALDVQAALSEYLAREQEYSTVLAEGAAILAERTRLRKRLANVGTQRRYADMYARVARNAALSEYRTAFDVAQRRVFELARLYDYETGLGAVGTPSGTNTFADAALTARALGVRGVTGDGSVTDGGLWELVTRMDANYAQVKSQLGFNNPDVSEDAFSLRFSNFRIGAGASGDGAWREQLANCWCEDVFADAEVAAHCQRPAGAVGAQPGFVIPFETSIYLAKNFFGKPLMGGDKAYSSSAQGVKFLTAGLDLSGYGDLVAPNGLAAEPDVYLVPLGADRQRLSDGDNLVERRFPIAPTRLSTLRADGTASSRQLFARCVWNDKWVIVIPAASLHSDPRQAREIFLNGINGHSGVGDVKLLIRSYAR